jgi:hypothetical protein
MMREPKKACSPIETRQLERGARNRKYKKVWRESVQNCSRIWTQFEQLKTKKKAEAQEYFSAWNSWSVRKQGVGWGMGQGAKHTICDLCGTMASWGRSLSKFITDKKFSGKQASLIQDDIGGERCEKIKTTPRAPWGAANEDTKVNVQFWVRRAGHAILIYTVEYPSQPRGGVGTPWVIRQNEIQQHQVKKITM